MKLEEVQAMCRIYIEAGVMSPDLVVLGIFGEGEYPIVMLHENVRKLVDADKAAEFEQFNVNWLLSLNPARELSLNEEGALASPALQFLNTEVYGKACKAEEDVDLWRLDAIRDLDDSQEQLGVVRIDDVEGFGIFGLGDRKMIFSVFGKAKKIVKLLEQQIN